MIPIPTSAATLPARLVISSTLIVGETNLNISDIDLVYQAVDGVELVWVGANLSNQVHVGIDAFSGSPHLTSLTIYKLFVAIRPEQYH